jgi:hypothetical protein
MSVMQSSTKCTVALHLEEEDFLAAAIAPNTLKIDNDVALRLGAAN